ncbi:guanine nucleotide binding protein, alpha subunit [Favolaschia claudopus]|uniref:Guanine nucleotide binding protein, alpha subunit n=1 Tax=Favolaschia claudopus TaxID=2862362 RepID=A0AAV9Z833_9AGAR
MPKSSRLPIACMFSLDEADPISQALSPPQNESEQDKQKRDLRERAAKLASDEIDARLNKERLQIRRTPKPVKILLLGQSESGKSTMLKNFQLMCEPKAFRAERASWRLIIHLNVIRSIRIILDALASTTPSEYSQYTPRSSYASQHSTHSTSTEDLVSDLLPLRARLAPVLELEETLKQRLAARANLAQSQNMAKLSFSGPLNSTIRLRRANQEISVGSSATMQCNDVDDDSARILYERSADLLQLWQNQTVHAVLERRKIRLRESAGFFLDELETVTSLQYVPTDEHILRARLRTLGVSEHRMLLSDPYGGITREFRLYDVGGHRSMRAKWAPYFDDMDAIIFVVPISAFDQVLAEDHNVNRLADSIELWTSIVTNELLQNSNMILLLNKIDILQAKLASGILFADYFPSYGLRPNDYDSVSRYVSKKFNSILQQRSPSPRVFYCRRTNATDAQSTAFVLLGIKDMLMRYNLKESLIL